MSNRPPWASAIVTFVLAVCAALAAHVWRPTVHLSDQLGKPDLEALFPKQFGEWREDTRIPVILPAADVQAKLNAIYNQTTYVDAEGQRIMLSVAYGGDQSDGTRAHRPEVCYPAQGFQMLSGSTAHVELSGRQPLKVRRLEAALGSRHEPITYWVLVGHDTATSSTEQKLAQLRYGVRGVIPDGVLIRVSNIGSELEPAYALHDRFIRALEANSSAAARLRVFGRSGASE
jgi:EpsI family protein